MRLWRIKNKEKIRQYASAYRKKEPGKVRIAKRKWKLKNPDKVKLEGKRYRQRYPDKIKLKNKEYRRRNPDKFKAYNSSPRHKFVSYKNGSKVRNIEFNLTESQFFELLKNECHYCGSKENIGIDRINNNKGYSIDNCTACCSCCNYLKWKMSYDYFITHCQKISDFMSRKEKSEI